MQLSQSHPTAATCRALGVPRASLYRERRRLEFPREVRLRPSPPRTLSGPEREEVAHLLHCRRFVDKAPAAVWAELLDEGRYLCSIRTMYRILKERNEVRERRLQRRHPQYEKPELLATAPNQCWSWDITKLKGPVKWSYYYLYVVMDMRAESRRQVRAQALQAAFVRSPERFPNGHPVPPSLPAAAWINRPNQEDS